MESEPLIPAETRFLLTTNSSLVPPLPDDPSSSAHINVQAYGRYFERPEVQKACRDQQLIQVPEFSLLPEDAVASRFRPRASEEVRNNLFSIYHTQLNTTRQSHRKRLIHQMQRTKNDTENTRRSRSGSGCGKRRS